MTTSQENEMELGHANGSSKNDHGGNASDSIIIDGNPEPDSDLDDDGHPRRTGTAWTASAHIITAVLGSGVLSLSWSLSILGWIVGPLVLVAFAVVTLYTAFLQADFYRYPDPLTGKRNYNYIQVVRVTLGERNAFWCGVVQYGNLIGTSIGYTITSAICMVAVQRSNCFHNRNHSARCYASNNPYMAAFGVCELLFSQIPDFARIWWLSIVAAIMSLFYSGVGFGLGISRFTEGGHSHGTLRGMTLGAGETTTPHRAWYTLQALGSIAFAYSFSTVLIEVQDTLRGPPNYPVPQSKTMKKAIWSGILVPSVIYMSVASAGYLAFGGGVPRNILTGFGFYSPFWLVDIANIAVVIHLVGAYQVFSQPVFALVEIWARAKWPNSSFIQDEKSLKVRFYGLPRPLTFNWFRIVWRSSFVLFTTVVAILMPFFTDVTGLIGAFSFWPLTVYFPVKSYIKVTGLKPWTLKWTALQSLSCFSFMVSLAAGVGSAEGIIEDLKDYHFFHTTL